MLRENAVLIINRKKKHLKEYETCFKTEEGSKKKEQVVETTCVV